MQLLTQFVIGDQLEIQEETKIRMIGFFITH